MERGKNYLLKRNALGGIGNGIRRDVQLTKGKAGAGGVERATHPCNTRYFMTIIEVFGKCWAL